METEGIDGSETASGRGKQRGAHGGNTKNIGRSPH